MRSVERSEVKVSNREAGGFFGPSMWSIREGIRKLEGRLGWREGRCARSSINEVPAIRRGVWSACRSLRSGSSGKCNCSGLKPGLEANCLCLKVRLVGMNLCPCPLIDCFSRSIWHQKVWIKRTSIRGKYTDKNKKRQLVMMEAETLYKIIQRMAVGGHSL